MSLMMISQCNRDLDFGPIEIFPAGLPAFSWHYRLLTGFDRQESLVIDLASTSRDFIQAFHSAYPRLTLPELARFYVRGQQLPEPPVGGEDWPRFFEPYGFRYQLKFSQILRTVAQCAPSFQTWLSEKQVGPGDLEPLLAAPLNLLEPMISRWTGFNFSKSEGVQVLEYLVDLRVNGKDWSELLPAPRSKGSAILSHLRNLRYPDTSQRDEEKRKTLRALPWPKQTQAQWLRKGDQGLLEIRFSASSLEDLRGKLDKLTHLEDLLGKSETTPLWKN